MQTCQPVEKPKQSTCYNVDLYWDVKAVKRLFKGLMDDHLSIVSSSSNFKPGHVVLSDVCQQSSLIHVLFLGLCSLGKQSLK